MTHDVGVFSAGLLAVSCLHDEGGSAGEGVEPHGSGASLLRVPLPAHGGAVAILDVARSAVLATLDAHTDVVRCMCALPDGGLATGGGPQDRSVRVWARSQWEDQPREERGGDAVPVRREATQTLSAPGYVFALAALPDANPGGSKLFALACASTTQLGSACEALCIFLFCSTKISPIVA